MAKSGYSATPLVKKLGLKKGFVIKLINEPTNYFNLLSSLPEGTEVETDDKLKYDFIHFFSNDIYEVFSLLPELKNQIKPDGMIWISWPKKSSKMVSNVTGNEIRAAGLAQGLVDIKICAVDEIWSGLKFVIPVKDRKHSK